MPHQNVLSAFLHTEKIDNAESLNWELSLNCAEKSFFSQNREYITVLSVSLNCAIKIYLFILQNTENIQYRAECFFLNWGFSLSCAESGFFANQRKYTVLRWVFKLRTFIARKTVLRWELSSRGKQFYAENWELSLNARKTVFLQKLQGYGGGGESKTVSQDPLCYIYIYFFLSLYIWHCAENSFFFTKQRVHYCAECLHWEPSLNCAENSSFFYKTERIYSTALSFKLRNFFKLCGRLFFFLL
jgi:hypothetical protein